MGGNGRNRIVLYMLNRLKLSVLLRVELWLIAKKLQKIYWRRLMYLHQIRNWLWEMSWWLVQWDVLARSWRKGVG